MASSAKIIEKIKIHLHPIYVAIGGRGVQGMDTDDLVEEGFHSLSGDLSQAKILVEIGGEK